MKDFRIGDLGGARGINGINNKTKVNTAQTNKTNFNMAEALKRFGSKSPVDRTAGESGIQELNLPPHMKAILSDVATSQNGISAEKPLTNPKGENLVISDADYIPDEAFKEKRFAEV